MQIWAGIFERVCSCCECLMCLQGYGSRKSPLECAPSSSKPLLRLCAAAEIIVTIGKSRRQPRSCEGPGGFETNAWTAPNRDNGNRWEMLTVTSSLFGVLFELSRRWGRLPNKWASVAQHRTRWSIKPLRVRMSTHKMYVLRQPLSESSPFRVPPTRRATALRRRMIQLVYQLLNG